MDNEYLFYYISDILEEPDKDIGEIIRNINKKINILYHFQIKK